MPLATFAAWRLMVTLQETKSCLQGIHISVDEYNPPMRRYIAFTVFISGMTTLAVEFGTLHLLLVLYLLE